MKRIAWIGLGNMGLPMAQNLKKAGFAVSGFDLAPEMRARAEASGLDVSGTIAKAVEGCDAAITMLPAGDAVRTVVAELVASVGSNTLLIDCSTIDVDSARAVHRLSAAHGLAALDAPVSGGVGGASAGTLTFMVGGDAEALGRARPLFQAMGRKTVYCGGAGSGQAAKLCNNLILGISMIGVCEAFALGERLHLSHAALFEVAANSSGQCWALTSYCPVPGLVPTSPANRDYAPGFSAGLMLKDLTLAENAAREMGAPEGLAARARALYASFAAKAGDTDFSGIITAFRDPPATEA
jgi:3-hydroxyisobutyrate dehydrogenase